MSRIITKFSVIALIAVVLFFFTFSSLYGQSSYSTSHRPDSLGGTKLKDESLEGAVQQKGATARPPTYVVSEGVKDGGEPTVSEEEKKRLEEEEKKRLEEEEKKRLEEEEKKRLEEEEKKRLEEEEKKRLEEEEKKRLEEEKRRQDEEKKQQEQKEQERKDKEADEKALAEYKKIKIHTGTFEVPKDLSHDPAGPKPDEIVLLAASDGKGHNGGIENILSDITTNRQEFASLHGYIYQFLDISKYDIGSAHPVWAKLPAIVDTFNLHPQAKWVWWLDLDAIIMSPQIDLAKHILSHEALSKKMLKNVDILKHVRRPTGIRTTANPDLKNIDFIVAQDQNGLNAGSFWIRRSEFSKLFIDMWADPMFVRENWAGQEQEAMGHLFKEHPTFLEHMALVQQTEINAYPLKNVEGMGWREGDLVVHLAGCWVEHKCNDQWKEYMAMRTPVASLPAANAAAAHE